jgi:type IV secretory pathway VirB2 component (pilin)
LGSSRALRTLQAVIREPLGHIARAVAVLAVVVAAVAGGIGWLYALRHVGALKAGPHLEDALPLQRLAGGAAQPLLRVVVAWLPAGLAAGVGVGLVSRLRRPARGLAVFVLALALVIAVAAASDSVTHSEPIRRHLHEQPHRAVTWLAAGLMALGAVLVPLTGRGAGRHEP